jgi:hypothetical protein
MRAWPRDPATMRAFLSLISVSLVLAFACFPSALAEAALTTRLHRNIPPSILIPTPAPLDGDTAAAKREPAQPLSDPVREGIRRLPAPSSGTARYDILEFLYSNGITRRPGQVAVYVPDERALVFTGAPEDQDLVERILETPSCFVLIKSIELSISTWTYLDDPIALVKNRAKSFEELQAIAGDTLRPVDSHLVVTRSGNRVPSIHLLAAEDGPPKATEVGELPPLKTPGSVLAIEPVVGPDGSTVDFQVEYRARIPQPGAADLCFAIETNATIGDGENLILQNLLFPPVDGQDPAKVRRCAVIAATRVIARPDKESQLTPEQRETRDQKIIADAIEGLKN